MPTKERWRKMTQEQRDAEMERTNQWRTKNKDKWNVYQRTRYLNDVGTLTRRSPLEMTEELRKEYYRNKALMRATRAKKARFTDELTQLVVKEAHELRKLRNKLTGIEWHVDHIEPLKGKDVCGLHIWSNLQVIPKIVNLSKGAKRAVY